MIEAQQLEALRDAYRDVNFYLTFSSSTTRIVLEEIIEHPYFPGVTDPSVLAFLGALLRIAEPERVLQLGTYIGFSALFMADILQRNRRPGHLVTVEPKELHHSLARTWANKAELQDSITFLDGYSTDDYIYKAFQTSGPFDLIYLDSSHSYESTLKELDLIFAEDGWLKPTGLLLLHDAGTGAARWDPSNEGGVRRALVEWLAGRYDAYYHLVLEPPFWPNDCGLGFVGRSDHSNVLRENTPLSTIKKLNEVIATKDRYIAQLEAHIRQVKAGRVMRLMNWLQGR